MHPIRWDGPIKEIWDWLTNLFVISRQIDQAREPHHLNVPIMALAAALNELKRIRDRWAEIKAAPPFKRYEAQSRRLVGNDDEPKGPV